MGDSKKRVLVIFGTRPEVIKMAPVIKALEERSSLFHTIRCATAQHRQMLDQMLSIFNISPDIDLDIMEYDQTLHSLSAKVIVKVSNLIEKIKPDVTLVQGDTTTAMIAGLASFYNRVPVGHVEAGLRTDDRYNPFPEEINRRLLSSLTTFHFAPTESAVAALKREGFKDEDIYLTGNTVVDALMSIIDDGNGDISLPVKGDRFILVTAHRRENFGKPIRSICSALKRIVKQNNGLEIVYPVHPNSNIYNPVRELLCGVEGIHLIEPVGYRQFVYMMKRAYLILTDSGGIQEEAPSLGKPVLIMRETTERPEAIEAGVARLVGTDDENITTEVTRLINDHEAYKSMAMARNPFGDGKAAERIVSILSQRLFS